MNRRTLLKWISRVIGWVCAAVVATAGAGFVITPLLRRRAHKTMVRRVARLGDLPAGVPTPLAVTGSRRDAWMVYPRETIGRVWVVRHGDLQTPAERVQVDVLTAVCPHLGCSVQFDAARGDFVCPCHKAVFDVTGKPLSDQELGYRNPAPRGMDSLPSRVVQDESSGQWWVEVEYVDFVHGLAKKVPKA